MSAPDPAAVWPKGRLVAHPQPGKVWVEVPRRNDIGSDWIEADTSDLLAAARTERAPEADGLREAVERLAATYERDAKGEPYGGELWSSTASTLRGLLAAHPGPEPQQAEADRAGSTIECYCYPGDKCDSPTHATPPADDASEGLCEDEREALVRDIVRRYYDRGVQTNETGLTATAQAAIDVLLARVAAARAEERRAVAEEIAQAIEVERSRRWQKHLADHPLSNASSCPYDYGEHDAMCAAAHIAREAGTR